MIRHCGRKTEAAMKVQLLMQRGFVRHSEIDQVLWTSTFRKSAGAFDVRVHCLRKLPVEVHTRLPRHIAPPCLRRPITENIPATVQLFGRERDHGT